MSPDQVIFGSFSSQKALVGEEVWSEVIAHVVGQMSRTLGHDVRLDGDGGIRFDDGFTLDFRSEGSGSSSWKFRLRGVMGTDVVDDALLVRAWVFIYLNNDRLSVEGQGHVMLMRYVKSDQGGVWEFDRWEFDEHGEWEPFEHFDNGVVR